jgi:hypothetical protein
MNSKNLPDSEDIDAFLKKVEDVERQLKGLQDGTLAPQDVAVPGAWTFDAANAAGASAAAAAKAEAARSEEERERQRGLALQRKWDAERAERLSREEADKWWRFARLQFGDHGVNAPPDAEAVAAALAGNPPPPPRRRAPPGPIDYSWWDKYADAPADAVRKAERE